MDSVKSGQEILKEHYRKFIDGSHILHFHHVLDAYGHLSFRHPFQPDVFVMSRSVAPATISSSADLIEYRVEDGEPVTPTTEKGYTERMIHSETYKRHPRVQAIVHSHSDAVVPYTISNVPLRACYHMAPWLGTTGAPVFDTAQHLRPGDVTDMLVRTPHMGAALAECFDNGNVITLMRGHGLTTVAPSIESAVFRAVYTQKNAAIQTTAITLQAAYPGSTRKQQANDFVKYLSDEECEGATEVTIWSVQRPWKLWVKEVEACELYHNGA